MAVLDALGSRLQTAGVGTLGTNIWLSQIQDSPDASIVLMEQQGNVDHVFGASTAAMFRYSVLAVARGARNDYPAARSLIENVRNTLGAIRNETISGVQFMSVLDATGIYPADQDGRERPLVACEFTCWVIP
jgi:hypothetical protein